MPCRHYIVFCPKDIILLTFWTGALIICPMDRIESHLKAAIYVRVSTADQHVESQLYDLRELAAKRGFEVVKEYHDCGISGRRARRPGLDALIADARRKHFSVILTAAFDRVARSVKHLLQLMDEFDDLGFCFTSRKHRHQRTDGEALFDPHRLDCRTRIRFDPRTRSRRNAEGKA
jgi:hypothetical protein